MKKSKEDGEVLPGTWEPPISIGPEIKNKKIEKRALK